MKARGDLSLACEGRAHHNVVPELTLSLGLSCARTNPLQRADSQLISRRLRKVDKGRFSITSYDRWYCLSENGGPCCTLLLQLLDLRSSSC